MDAVCALGGDVVDGIGAVLVHARGQVDPQRHDAAERRHADHSGDVVHGRDGAGDVRAVAGCIVRHRIDAVGEIPVLGAARQKVGREVGMIEIGAGVDHRDDHLGVSAAG